MHKSILIAALLLSPTTAAVAQSTAPGDQAVAQGDFRQQIDTILDNAPAGARIGMAVETLNGQAVYHRTADQRFIPASNTKIFITAAAYARLDSLQAQARGTAVALRRGGMRGTDVILVGWGDPSLSSAEDCVSHCLADLADAVAAQVKEISSTVGVDSHYLDERWSAGMSWNNIPYPWGTGVSALSVDDNILTVEITPAKSGSRPDWKASSRYYNVSNVVDQVPGNESDVHVHRIPGDRSVLVSGRLGSDAQPVKLRLGVDDPADYAAFRLHEMLIDRGVVVKQGTAAIHNPAVTDEGMPKPPGLGEYKPVIPETMTLELPASSIADDIRVINKTSQNLHAELLLRRLGVGMDGEDRSSVESGLAAMRGILAEAGLSDTDYSLFDGSGMSTYNRVTPRGMARLLRWIDGQAWGADWQATLPIGGVDGTLKRRFADTVLAGKIFAKTGSINGTRALSGYLQAASGQRLVFSVIANDIPDEQTGEAIAAMDAALLAIAAAN